MFIYLENGNLNNEKKGAPFSIEYISTNGSEKKIYPQHETHLLSKYVILSYILILFDTVCIQNKRTFFLYFFFFVESVSSAGSKY